MEYYLGHGYLWDLISDSKGSTEEISEAQHKRNTKARCKIGMLVYPQCHIHLKGKGTANKIWEVLKVANEDTGANIVCIILERLFDIKLKYGATCDKKYWAWHKRLKMLCVNWKILSLLRYSLEG
ncbi:hypothetical protein PR048_027878 [Dryococelus australis]|uniref:Uncharacterized protein n=1 Tax=Dryococelus australis TaxID=614101 RepID=A0ABQ9GHT1_9NEOP|nr:hypothetical protein PR048_027878 [Dryococelus australis]